MPWWKQCLLSAYYYGSYPTRTWRNVGLQNRGNWPVLVVCYHRIADDRATPWTESNRMFARQIRWLQRNFEIVPLADAQRRIRSGANPRPVVAITFDDGYADNCQQALPLLVSERIPCTYFVSTAHVFTGQPFAHDIALGRRLAPNTPDQIRALAQAGIEIGTHTRTHADIGQINDRAVLHDEIVHAREELEALCDTRIRYFAFPYGHPQNMSPAAFDMARAAGYSGVCSAYGGFNFPSDDDFHLRRIVVDDDMIRLKNWLTLDPRKLRMYPRDQPVFPAAPRAADLEAAR